MKAVVLERTAQNVPVPIGSLSPVRRDPSGFRRWLRRNRGRCVMASGLLLTGAGVLLALMPSSLSVYMDRGTVHIGSLELHEMRGEASAQVFTGAMTLALTSDGSRIVRGAGVATMNGAHVSGVCDVTASGARLAESCRFWVAGRTTVLTASDTFDAASRTWLRRYSDGVTVTFSVPQDGQMVPIPVPLGHN